MTISVFICGLVLLFVTHCDVRNINCPELPEKALRAILGTTYNARYMRIELPIEEDSTSGGGSKRASGYDEQDFFLDDSESNPYEGIPAWEVDHVEISKSRQKRHHQPATQSNGKRNARQAFVDKMTKSSKQDVFQSRPWDCKAEVHWMDMGPDYFPRYIRTIQCKKKNCWYGHYTCKPRWFSIKVLRRSTGQCAKVNERFRIVTMDAVSGDYAQQWEFEEKAVTFCCDCVMEY